jgi:hypothetical protein
MRSLPSFLSSFFLDAQLVCISDFFCSCFLSLIFELWFRYAFLKFSLPGVGRFYIAFHIQSHTYSHIQHNIFLSLACVFTREHPWSDDEKRTASRMSESRKLMAWRRCEINASAVGLPRGGRRTCRAGTRHIGMTASAAVTSLNLTTFTQQRRQPPPVQSRFQNSRTSFQTTQTACLLRRLHALQYRAKFSRPLLRKSSAPPSARGKSCRRAAFGRRSRLNSHAICERGRI